MYDKMFPLDWLHMLIFSSTAVTPAPMGTELNLNAAGADTAGGPSPPGLHEQQAQ
ncbi:hypothetical protein ACFSQ7_28040 [Paenibacillus rhizoplanae]